MKRLKIITLLLLVAAFSFSQTNGSFQNMDIRGTTKMRGIIYPFGAVATSPVLPAVHEILMVNNSTFAMCRMDFEEFADSIANVLNPIIGTYWDKSGNYLYPINFATDSVGIGTATPERTLDVVGSFRAVYDSTYMGYDPLNLDDTVLYFGIKNSDTSAYHQILSNYSGGQDYLNQLIWVGHNDNSGNPDVFSSIELGYANNPFETYININSADGNTTDETAIGISPASIEIRNNRDVTITSDSVTFNIAGDPQIIIVDDSTVINGDLTVTGQVKYDYKHLVIYTTGGSYNPNVTQNVEFKLKPTFSTTENDGLTFAGDSITVITPGDYYIQFAVSFQAASGDDWIFKCRKNGVAITTGNLALTTTGAGNYCSGTWFYYLLSLVAGDDICFTVTGENVGADDPTFRSIKVFMEMKPE